MRIDRATLGFSADRRPHQSDDIEAQQANAIAPSRALVPAGQRSRRNHDAKNGRHGSHPSSFDRFTRTRAEAAFIAHLIAGQMDLPQTRQRRRAPLNDAVTAYGAGPIRASAMATGELV